MRTLLFLFLIIHCPLSIIHCEAQSPTVTSWIINPGAQQGYGGLLSNVQSIRYSATQVYVAATCIPGYDVGPWAGNPNLPANQNFVFKITRNPQPNSGTKVATPLGHVGVWRNGVSVFNALDARSYQNNNVWFQNAFHFEGASFDSCLGHPAPNGEYHHHVNPLCLYDAAASTVHSPIIGYAFDGYPMYGAWAYANRNGTGAIVRMRSGYTLRNITARITLPNGTVLAANRYGPAINAQFPLSAYLQDFTLTGDTTALDAYNGRWCITPEYPAGTYAYFVTLDATGAPAYPYTVGPSYYGLVQAGNTGPQSGHNVISEPVTTYTPTAALPVHQPVLTITPNPAAGQVTFTLPQSGGATAQAISSQGAVYALPLLPAGEFRFMASVQHLPAGLYSIQVVQGRHRFTAKLVRQ